MYECMMYECMYCLNVWMYVCTKYEGTMIWMHACMYAYECIYIYVHVCEGKATRLAELAIYNVAVSDTSHSKL